MKRRLSKVSRRLQIQSLEARELLAGDLRIVEMNYHPHAPLTQFGERDSDADDFEFVEVMNVGDPVTLTISLSGPPSLAEAELPPLTGISDRFALGSDPPEVEIRNGEKVFRQNLGRTDILP